MSPDSAGSTGAVPYEFRMPSLGADMASGKVVRWCVAPGDTVAKGDVIAEVETEKGVFEVEVGVTGVMGELLVERGAKVPVGTVLARVAVGAGVGEQGGVRAPERASTTGNAEVTEAGSGPAPPPRRRASPLARRMAEEAGVSLADVEGSGAGGVITREDVERAIAVVAGGAAATAVSPAATPAAEGAEAAQEAMRRAVAAAVSRSKREIPHYYLGTDIDLAKALGWLAERNRERPVTARVLPAALLLQAIARALVTYPLLNGTWVDDAFHPGSGVHAGVAISLRGGGLIAPAIHDADRLDLDALMKALGDLVRRARSGGLRGSEMTDATVTVSNLGDEGVATVFGVIYPPQVALVGLGRVTERPWARDGMLGVHPVVTMTLAGDHRATDGHYGARFLNEVDRLLQSPEAM